MAIREGAWDCPSCGRKDNRGPEKHCAGCGHPRGPEVQFYLPRDAPEVDDAAALGRAQAGPDWSCAYCGGDNRSDADFCTGCGASRDGAPPRPVIEHRDPAPGGPQPLAAPAAAPVQEKRQGWGKGCAALGCLGLVLAAVAIFLLGRPQAETLTVQGFAWERTVEVETAETVTETGWEGELPEGARALSRERAVYEEKKTQIGTETKTVTVTERVQTGTERVKVGVRDLGNGYFEDIYEDRPVYEDVERRERREEPVYRTDPVYRTRVRYQVERWTASGEERLSGRDQSPRWPQVPQTSRQRPGKRTESYQVSFTDADGRTHLYEAESQAEWSGFRIGQRFLAKVRGGKVLKLERARLEEGPG